MEIKRKTRVELYKKEIEESKLYNSLEKQTLNNSKSLQSKKEFLKKLDQDYFSEDIEQHSKTIKPLEKAKLFDYTLSVKLKEIKDSLTTATFDIPFRKSLITKVEQDDQIKELIEDIRHNHKKFSGDIDYHEINFNKQISELNKKWKEIEENREHYIEDEVIELQKASENLFEKTKGYKIGLTQKTDNMDLPKNKSKVNWIHILVLSGLLLLMWFMRG